MMQTAHRPAMPGHLARRSLFPRVWILPALVLLAAMPAGLARADAIVVTYSAPGTTTADYTALCAGATHCDYGMENFGSWAGGNFTSDFTSGGYSTPDGVTFSGSYVATDGTTTSQWVRVPSNEYGGDPGGYYPELFGPGAVSGPEGQTQSSYTLTLSASNLPSGATTGINYFGIWISALDRYNDMLVFDTGGEIIAHFNSSVLLAALGSCAGGHATNAYCGNPEDGFADAGELFAFVNIYDLDGTIGSVEFFNSGSTGFESDNDTVAYLDPIQASGTVLADTSVPEPSSAAVLAAGLLALFGLRRRVPPLAGRFAATARAIGADGDEATFQAKLAMIARQVPKDVCEPPPHPKGKKAD